MSGPFSKVQLLLIFVPTVVYLSINKLDQSYCQFDKVHVHLRDVGKIKDWTIQSSQHIPPQIFLQANLSHSEI